MKTGRTLRDLAVELHRQIGSKQDMIVSSPLMRHSTDEVGGTRITIDGAGAPLGYGMTPLARRQLADKLKIPYPYFERMREEKPVLLDSNVNTWLQIQDKKRMIRTLDGKVRAVLSNRYRRVDNYDVVETILPVLEKLPGAKFESVELTETKLYLKVVTPNLQTEMQPGDVVQAGVVVSNSEVGHGMAGAQPFLYRCICSNGCVSPDYSLRMLHIGKTLGAETDITIFKDETLEADDRAFLLMLRDMVEAAISQATFMQMADKLRKTLGIPLVGNPVKTVEVLAQRYSLNDEERSGVLRNLIAEGSLTGYGLVNAVTHYSHEIEDYDRASEFEELGGKLIELSPTEWKPMAEAA